MTCEGNPNSRIISLGEAYTLSPLSRPLIALSNDNFPSTTWKRMCYSTWSRYSACETVPVTSDGKVRSHISFCLHLIFSLLAHSSKPFSCLNILPPPIPYSSSLTHLDSSHYPRRHRDSWRELDLFLLNLKPPFLPSLSTIPFLLDEPFSSLRNNHFLLTRLADAPLVAGKRDHDALDVAAAAFPCEFV